MIRVPNWQTDDGPFERDDDDDDDWGDLKSPFAGTST